MYAADIIIGFAEPYDRFLFKDLPEHFEFISDKYGYQPPYTLTYVLNHLGRPMSAIMLDYCGHPDRSEPAEVVLKDAINQLYEWAVDIRGSGKWAVYKLGGYL